MAPQWERHQQAPYDRVYAYSLYAEVLGELGLMGIVLLGASLLTVLVAIAVRARGPGRSVYAVSFALVLAWIVHAGVDIDWQTPAVSVFVFALGGLALAGEGGRDAPQAMAERPGRRLRAAVLAGKSARWLAPVLALTCLAIAVIPARMALAQARLRDSVDALDAGACASAQASAHGAISALDTGSRPYEVLAMCAARRGNTRAAVAWAQLAVAHDPGYWEPHYVLALAEGTGGIDPRRQAMIAYEDDPLGELPRLAVASLGRSDPRYWRTVARTLPFSVGR